MKTRKDLTLRQAQWFVKQYANDKHSQPKSERLAAAWWYMAEGIRYDSQLLRTLADMLIELHDIRNPLH